MKSPLAIEMKKLNCGKCSCCLNEEGLELHTLTTLFDTEYCLVYCPSCEQVAGSLNKK